MTKLVCIAGGKQLQKSFPNDFDYFSDPSDDAYVVSWPSEFYEASDGQAPQNHLIISRRKVYRCVRLTDYASL